MLRTLATPALKIKTQQVGGRSRLRSLEDCEEEAVALAEDAVVVCEATAADDDEEAAEVEGMLD
jgi:hypothetical protein